MGIKENIGKRMKMIRLYSSLKQKNLAEDLGVQASVLSMYEQGNREPTLTFLSKYCEYFNISIAQFFASEHFGSTEKTQNDFQRISSSLSEVLSQLEKMGLETRSVK